MKNIALYGAGGHSFATIALIKSIGTHIPTVVYDDAPSLTEILAVPVQKFTQQNLVKEPLCIAIGNNKTRKIVSQKFKAIYPSFTHKSAVIYPSALIGDGTLVLPNVVIDAAAVVGNFCIVNNNATISHNAVVEDFCHIAINAAIAGGVTIGEGTLVGAGSVVLPEVTIGKWATIGAGCVITKDIPDYAVAYGNPAVIQKYTTP